MSAVYAELRGLNRRFDSFTDSQAKKHDQHAVRINSHEEKLVDHEVRIVKLEEG